MQAATTGLTEGDFTLLRVLSNAGVMTNILDLIAAGGGGSGSGIVSGVQLPLSVNGGVLSIDTSGFATSAQTPLSLQNGVLDIDLAAYATTTAMNTAISNALAAYTDTTGLTVLLGGKISTSHEANNIGVADVDFGAYCITAQKLKLIDKDLEKGGSGQLLWGGSEVQLKANSFQQINVVAPLTISGSTAVTIESLWRPSSVSLGNGITGAADNAQGTLSLAVDGSVFATLAYVQANFLSPLNPGTVGVTAGLSAAMTANTLVISVDESTDSRTQFILRDSGNTARVITANTTGQLLYNNAALATEAQVATKQNNLTSGDGIFISGSTIKSYSLRWLINNTPSIPIECLHFRDGFTVSETLNQSSQQVELQIRATPAIADVTGLQAEVNKLTDVIDGVSGVSLGIGQGASQRIALYEIEPGQALTAGHYFYGVGLFEGQSQGLGVGLGMWGGSGLALPDQFGTGGQLPHALITFGGNMGIGNVNPSERLTVAGNILATGTITGSTKSFDIEHPDPSKAGQRLRHWCYEGDDAGGAVMYRRQLHCNRGNNVLQMPNFFKHLCTDVLCFSSPVHHFGLTWAAQDEDDGNQIIVGASRDGIYNVLVTARRNDECATTMCPQEVEYTPAPPDHSGESPFPV